MPPMWYNWTHQMGMLQQEVQITLPNNKGSPLVTEKWVGINSGPGIQGPAENQLFMEFYILRNAYIHSVLLLANLTWPINFLSVAIVHIVFSSIKNNECL